MRQITFASQPSFEKYGRKSRREEFLSTMEAVVPWSELEVLIAPYYPKAGKGRQPIGLSTMLRIYFLQHWFKLSDPGAEDALYASPVLRRFAGVDLGRAAAPDETTILRFRRLLEQHELCGQILDAVNHYLASRGLRIATGTIVDATIIAAPSSIKNNKKERDPEMHQTRKGNQWYFGAKAHIGMDSKEGIVHFGGFGLGRAHAARSAARRREEGLGRRRLPGPNEGHPCGRSRSAGHDFAARKIQRWCR